MKFELTSTFKPTGDQPGAIEKLVTGLNKGYRHQTLLGVTGSGKTFTIANVINAVQKPTLVISHNKTLAAQLYQEFREFFADTAVCYFVSYYDYYQPEAYIASTDTYIEKETEVNEEIDRLRLATTTALSTRRDVVVVASVSAIYNLGSPLEYKNARIELVKKQHWSRRELLTAFSRLQYERNDYDFKRGTYRARGDTIEIYPAYENLAVRVNFLDETLKRLEVFNPVSGKTQELPDHFFIYPAKHYITSEKTTKKAIESIKQELKERVAQLEGAGKNLEAYRLTARTNYDIEMILTLGYCKGIENYSRHFDGRSPGDPPFSLIEHFPKDYLLIIDESHMTVPQINGMYNGDRSRKTMLIDFGFRLPSAYDNRPLKFGEFEERVNQAIYTSATPAEYETGKSQQIVEQLIRPTGLLDPQIVIKPSKGQIEDLITQIKLVTKRNQRVLITTLTKRMAEELANFLQEEGLKVQYLHSDVQTLDRIDILDDLRLGNYDVLVGINLLREGLDLPEVSLVAILDADKEGFLRSETALIQTMGRAARHIQGQVILYADTLTTSMKKAIDEIERRRQVQIIYNKKNRIIPKSIEKPIRGKLVEREKIYEEKLTFRDQVIEKQIDQAKHGELLAEDKQRLVKLLGREMREAARILDFDRAAFLRDQIYSLRGGLALD